MSGWDHLRSSCDSCRADSTSNTSVQGSGEVALTTISVPGSGAFRWRTNAQHLPSRPWISAQSNTSRSSYPVVNCKPDATASSFGACLSTATGRVTFAAGADSFPLWSPSGDRIVFRSVRNAHRQIHVKPSSGAGSEELLLELQLETDLVTNDWSPDGRFVLYHSRNPQTDRDLWVLPLEGDRKPWLFLKTSFAEAAGQFSPDGRWVAYQSNESGRFEIYVRPFVEPTAADSKATSAGGQWQVSTAGGLFARWRADGRELYYIGPDGQMMAAPTIVTGTVLEPGTPVALFQTRIVGGGSDTNPGRQYDVTRDGRFLINTVVEGAAAPITLLQNWTPPAQ